MPEDIPVGPGIVAQGKPSCVIRSVNIESPPVDLYVRGYKFATSPAGDVRVVLSDGQKTARLTVERSAVRVNADIATEQVRFHAQTRHRWRDVVRPLDMKLEAVEHGQLRGSFVLPPSIVVDPSIAREMRVPCKDARYGWVERTFDDPDEIDRQFVKDGARVPIRMMPDRKVALTLAGIDGSVAHVYQRFKGSTRVGFNLASVANGIPAVQVLGWVPRSVLRGPKRYRGKGVPGGVPGGVAGGWIPKPKNRELRMHTCVEEAPLFVRVEDQTIEVGRLGVGARIGFVDNATESGDSWRVVDSNDGNELLSSWPPVRLIDRAAFIVHESALTACPETDRLRVR